MNSICPWTMDMIHPRDTFPVILHLLFLSNNLYPISPFDIFSSSQRCWEMFNRAATVWNHARIASPTSSESDILQQTCKSSGSSSDPHCIEISPSISQHGVEESFSHKDKLLLPHHNSTASRKRRCWKRTPSRKSVFIMLGITISLCLGIM